MLYHATVYNNSDNGINTHTNNHIKTIAIVIVIVVVVVEVVVVVVVVVVVIVLITFMSRLSSGSSASCPHGAARGPSTWRRSSPSCETREVIETLFEILVEYMSVIFGWNALRGALEAGGP